MQLCRLLPSSRLLSLRAGFGLSLFAKSSNQARLDLLAKGLPGLVVMLTGLVATLGNYYKLTDKERAKSHLLHTKKRGREGLSCVHVYVSSGVSSVN